jgi:hypothetical protein
MEILVTGQSGKHKCNNRHETCTDSCSTLLSLSSPNFLSKATCMVRLEMLSARLTALLGGRPSYDRGAVTHRGTAAAIMFAI